MDWEKGRGAFSPSLINFMVSVDVKPHIYSLYVADLSG